MMYEGNIKQETRNVQENLFKPASWQAKIDFINHLVLYNNVLMAILAEKAGGKTAFVHLLQEHADANIKTCILTAEATLNRDSILVQLIHALHLPQAEDGPVTMASLIEQINARKSFVLIIIDDAENLPEDWLRETLYELQQQKAQCYFHLCLVSVFSVVAKYNTLVKEDKINSIHCIELGTLNENETKTYVLHKNTLKNTPYTEEQLKHLYKMTGGCMAKINHYLATNQPSVQAKKSLARVWYTAFAASFAIIAAGISWLTFEPTEHVENVKIDTIIVEKIKDEPLCLSQIPNWQDGYREFVYQELPKSQTIALVDEQDLSNEIHDQTVDENTVVIPSININKTTHVSEEKTASFIAPIEKKITTAVIQTKQSTYTIQVLASHNIDDIHRFIRQHALEGKCAIRRVHQGNDAWYILTLGEYPTSAQAHAAIHHLSTKVAQAKPWVRLATHLQLIG